MSSAYENAMSDLQANNYTQKYPVDQKRKYCPDCGSLLPDETHEDWCFCKQYEQRAEAAESRAAQAEAERDELARKLEQAQRDLHVACNEIDDDVTRLSWLQSLITSVLPFIELISGGDVNAGMMCISEVQSLHDDLQKLVSEKITP